MCSHALQCSPNIRAHLGQACRNRRAEIFIKQVWIDTVNIYLPEVDSHELRTKIVFLHRQIGASGHCVYATLNKSLAPK